MLAVRSDEPTTRPGLLPRDGQSTPRSAANPPAAVENDLLTWDSSTSGLDDMSQTAQARFKRIKGHRQLPVLFEALKRRAAAESEQRLRSGFARSRFLLLVQGANAS